MRGTRLLVGNRLALIGAIIYLLEWVAILGFGAGNAPSSFQPGSSTQTIIAQYEQHAFALSLQVGWFSLVLLGRILLMTGVRAGLELSGYRSPLTDFAVVAMAASVVLEIASYAITGGTAHYAVSGGDRSTIVALDAVASWLNLSLAAPLFASVLAAALAMFLSSAFPRWLCWLGIVAGSVGCVASVVHIAAFQQGGVLWMATNTPWAIAVLGFWVWMLVTGFLLFRAAGRNAPQAALPKDELIG